jgi:hypothetical protein
MRKTKKLLTVSYLFLAGIGAFALAQSRTSQREGAKPFTPTRLEWMAVELNAQMRTDATAENPFQMTFVPVENEDAILIYVTYLPSVDREIMNQAVETARQVIAINSKSRGWNSWMNVKERIEMSSKP